MELEEALKLIETQKAEAEKAKAEMDSILAKNKELLDETKTAKQKAKEEAELSAKAIADKALKDGDFEQLLKSSEEARKSADTKLAELMSANEQSVHVNQVNAYAMSFDPVSEHTMDDLAHRLNKRTKIVDGELKVLDKKGNLTVSSLDDLKSELLASGEISNLIKGNQSSGGDAPGGSNKSQTVNPFQKGEHFNLTSQAALLKTDPAQAAAFKVAAQSK